MTNITPNGTALLIECARVASYDRLDLCNVLAEAPNIYPGLENLG